MGETWLWVKAEKVFPRRSLSSERKVTFKVLTWGLGAGHGDHYGRNFPGKQFTVSLKCGSARRAAALQAGELFWVFHHASSSFGRNPETGEKIYYSHSEWKLLGTGIWVREPVPVSNLNSGEQLPSSPQLSLYWAIRHGNNVTVKVRHDTQGKLGSTWKIIKTAETRDRVTLAIVFKNHPRPGNPYTNNLQSEDHLFQFSAAAFSGKDLRLTVNGKRLIDLPTQNK